MKTPTHPAELLKDFIGEEKLISVKKASILLGCHQRTLEKIMDYDKNKEQNRGISQELGWKISQVFDTDKEFWNNIQKTYDLWKEVSKNDIESIMKFNKDDIDFIRLVTHFHKKNDESPHPAKIIKHLIGDDKKYNITEAGLIMGIPRKTLSDFLQYDDFKNDNISLSSKMAIKIGNSFQMEPADWMQLQVEYDSKNIKRREDLGINLLGYLKKVEDKENEIKDDDVDIGNFVKNKIKTKRKPV